MTLPRELDEAAMIDGISPFEVAYRVIIPQSWPAIISVSLFVSTSFSPGMKLLAR